MLLPLFLKIILNKFGRLKYFTYLCKIKITILLTIKKQSIMIKVSYLKEEELSDNILSVLKGTHKYFGNEITPNMELPTKFEFNKTYYIHYDNKLTAFKIIMCSYYKSGEYYRKWMYLVQFPNKIEWVCDFLKNKYIFETADDYFKYLNKESYNGFMVKYEWLSTLNQISYEAKYYYPILWTWDNSISKPKKVNAYFDYIILNENGLFAICHREKDKYYTEEECVKSKLNGMEIIDFPMETTFNLEIKMTNNEPIIRTLQFIEK